MKKMKRSFTKEEQKLYSDNLKYAEPKEVFICLWWGFVSVKKFFILIDGLKMGKSWMFAFRDAKKFK